MNILIILWAFKELQLDGAPPLKGDRKEEQQPVCLWTSPPVEALCMGPQ